MALIAFHADLRRACDLLERQARALEEIASCLARAVPPPLPDRQPYKAGIRDLATVDNSTSAQLAQDRAAFASENDLDPESELSYQAQYERLQKQFDELRAGVSLYEQAVEQTYGQGSSKELPWNAGRGSGSEGVPPQ